MIVVNYGMGTNSTALIVEALRRGIRPNLIITADTGSERPESYEYLHMFGEWVKQYGMTITVVKWIRKIGPDAGRFIPLHEACEQQKTLPSKAFGYSGCTSKWKQQPIDQYLETDRSVIESILKKEPVERWIGYDAEEPERAERMLRKNPHPDRWLWRAPLVEWDIGRSECIEIIKNAGLPLPGKSACWLCPSMTKPEILEMNRQHPELIQKAITIEENAELGTVKGLGRRFSWKSLIESEKKQLPVVEDTSISPAEIECGCYDG